MPLTIVRNDITRMEVDAVVNAANEGLRRGGGVCGAIFAAAGVSELTAACKAIGHCPTGSAVATPAFNLHARHIIHAVGPIWMGGRAGEEEALGSCYAQALELAYKLGDRSIAFPLISSGIYGYPKEEAIEVALHQIAAFLDTHEMEVYLTIFDAASLAAGKGRFAHIAAYIDDRYVDQSPYRGRLSWEDGVFANTVLSEEELSAPKPQAAPPMAAQAAPSAPAPAFGAAKPKTKRRPAGKDTPTPLDTLLQNLDAPFSTTLLAMIDERGLKDSYVYKRANMSRQHFSKIRSNPAYRPTKQTVLALAVALSLSLDECSLLLERAGFALTHADKRDVIVEYYITNKVYDIHEINLALYTFDQPLLG